MNVTLKISQPEIDSILKCLHNDDDLIDTITRDLVLLRLISATGKVPETDLTRLALSLIRVSIVSGVKTPELSNLTDKHYAAFTPAVNTRN